MVRGSWEKDGRRQDRTFAGIECTNTDIKVNSTSLQIVHSYTIWRDCLYPKTRLLPWRDQANHLQGPGICLMSASYPSSRQRRRWNWIDLIRLDGRASRLQWWLVVLTANAMMIMLLQPTVSHSTSHPDPVDPWLWVQLVVLVFFALFVVVHWTASVRRLHDRNKSGWWILLYFVPVVGHLWLFLELGVLPGTSGPNRYG